MTTAQLAPVAADTTSAATRPYRAWTRTANRYLLALVADGHTHRQIAARLGTTATAVTRQLQRIYVRLGAVNAPHAVAIALRSGFIPAVAEPSKAFVVVGPDYEVVLR
jgi:DNA-binding CsgD family transcriptional regulator